MPVPIRSHPPRTQSPRGLPARTLYAPGRLAPAALAAFCLLVGPLGCATPPSMERIEAAAQAAPATPQLRTARGALSPAQSKAALDQLKARAPGSGIYERHLAIEEAVAGTPLTVDNRATLL